ncbi:N-acetyltransferase 9-like protein [Oppia nitens]|uniref:N-acetyltransferase 9-like protein n=1 Tax=Oppia nitens TaxID=1686743 RepID=UPI0023DB7929|nr:N-acetyltransferase 9-like protein [Oppia nitens]
MSCNSLMKNRQIIGQSVVLVPYRELHVPKYNQWMKDPNLQYLTGSEPLTLEEELEMMDSWNSDENKCTFIILEKNLFQPIGDQIKSMIGDVNLFFDTTNNEEKTAEIEIMIAEESYRGKGRGKETVLLMLRFAIQVIGVKIFVAKIKYNNKSSQNMFIKIGFNERSRSDVFEEITYDLTVNDMWFESIVKNNTNLIALIIYKSCKRIA